MGKKVRRKILVIGFTVLFLGASATVGVVASFINRQIPRSIQHTIQAIQKNVIGQTSLTGNVLISDNAGNDYHPRITTNGLGHTIVVYEQEIDIFTKQVPLVYSTNDGDTWTVAYLFNSFDLLGSGLLGYPDIIYNPAQDLLLFQAVDPFAEMYNNEMYLIPGNIASGGAVSGYGISGADASNYWYAACTHTNDYFISATTEDHGGDLISILRLGWYTSPDFSFPPGLAGFYYDDNTLLRTAPVAELEADYNTNRWFVVAESEVVDGGTHIVIKSGTTDKALIDSGEQQNGMDKYGDISVAPGEFLDVGSDPDVSGSGSKVAVVFVQNGNILCSVSSCAATYEPEFNWQTTIVETGGASTPAVYMKGNNVCCAYVKGENLYLKVSEDGGATWGAAQKMNDVDGTVVAEKGAVDICRSGIAFTDTRNGNYDVYFAPSAAGGIIFHQHYYDTTEGPRFHTSDLNRGYLCQDDFWDLTDQITDVHWWGLTLIYTGSGWVEGNPDGMKFKITFYENSIGSPGPIVASFTDVIPTYTDTGLIRMGDNMIYFETDIPAVILADGWISIQSTYSPDNSRFLWAGSPEGNLNALQNGGNFDPSDSLAFNLTTGVVSEELSVSVDIKPATWPNSLNTQKKGAMPVAICGTDEFDVTQIDPATIKIRRDGVTVGVSLIRWSYADVATPYIGDDGSGHSLGADGYLDLCLKFDSLAVVTTLGLSSFVGDRIELWVIGDLLPAYGGTAIKGYDYVEIVK